MKKFHKYVLKNYLYYLLIILIFSLIIYTIFQLVQHTKYISRYNTPFLNILIFDLMKIPYSIYQVFPVAASAALVATMLKLIKNNELIAYLSLGGRLKNLAILFLSINLFFTIVLIYYSDAINPKIQKIRARYKEEKIFFEKYIEKASFTDFYFKDGDKIIGIDLIDYDKKELFGINIFQLNQNRVIGLASAKIGKYIGDNKWLLFDYKYFDLLDIPTIKENLNKYIFRNDTLTKFIKVKPDNPKELSFKNLRKVIKIYESKRLSTDSFKLIYYNKLANPLIILVLTILLLPVTIVISRSYQYLKIAVKSLTVVIVFWIFYSILYSIGKNGVIDPFVANFGAHFIGILVGFYMIFLKERWL
ncbi:LptF/LptG family permease [Deferribacter thermophilus]|uniref:LptF/LptG family permease n=1 Tax=Deferribacter thermophilus TaxID=53573 RepID=UPI003C25A9DE